jgi:hypothetical protein
MSAQLPLRFDEVPVTCPVQERYHEIAPILAGKCRPAEQAESLNVGYSTVTRWLREFREVDEAVEFHRELISDHNRLPHWAHHRRSDGKHSPLAVLGQAKGKQADPADIQQAFGQRYCQRLTDARGFVKIGRWKIYVEEGLPPNSCSAFILGR